MSLTFNGEYVESFRFRRKRSLWEKVNDGLEHAATKLIVPVMLIGGYAGSYVGPVLGF